jgi:hypothetical protein
MLIGRTARKTTAPALLSLSLIASLPTTAGAQGPTCTPAIDISRSLVVTDGALDKTKFALSRTIDAILGSMAIAKTAENRENFVKSMLTSFQDDDMVNPVSGLRMKVEVRPLEAGLDPKKLLNPADPAGLVPIALFNRLDAAPIDWSNCGEHRIVYSFKAPIPPEAGLPPFRTSRFLLIFEARVDNASPQKAGFEGCRAVANFWRSLTDENDEKMRAERLEQFYFTGIAGASGPVVQAKNYGGPLGQVRGNIFMNSAAHQLRWQLREWIVVNSGQPTPAIFVAVTVKDNPLSQFYLDANGPASDPDDGPLDEAKETSERAEFQNQFLNTSLVRLLDPDVVRNFLKPGQPAYAAELDPANAAFDAEKYRIEVLNRFGARFENRFNEFQSVSQGDADNPRAKAGPRLQANLGTALGQFVIDAQQKPDVTQVLNRAGAVSCGGCHQFTADQPVAKIKGQTIVWPKSAGFVHVTESGGLSDALTTTLLPFRRDRLAEAVCIEAAPITMSAAPNASMALESARQSRWQSLVATARDEKDPAAQRTRTREAVRAITVQRQEEIQKPGYFVTNRRPH